MPALRSEFLMQLSADLSDPQVLTDAPHGTRRIMYMKRGSFSGPRLTGQVLPGGGDWVPLRPDGVAELDIRLTLRTDDGELKPAPASAAAARMPITVRRMVPSARKSWT